MYVFQSKKMRKRMPSLKHKKNEKSVKRYLRKPVKKKCGSIEYIKQI